MFGFLLLLRRSVAGHYISVIAFHLAVRKNLLAPHVLCLEGKEFLTIIVACLKHLLLLQLLGPLVENIGSLLLI